MESTGSSGTPESEESATSQSAAPPPATPPPATPPPATPPPATPPPAPQPPSWVSNLTSTAPVVGPTGLVYADLPNRIGAYIIDMIGLAIFMVLVGAILTALGLNVATFDLQNGFQYNYVAALIQAAVGAAVSFGYFVYTWTTMQGTLGMKILGMKIGNATDGTPLTSDQAIRRWLAVGGWITIAQALNPLPLLGILVGVVAIGYVIYLLVTTAQSPTKQGFHDKFVGSVVVKLARPVA